MRKLGYIFISLLFVGCGGAEGIVGQTGPVGPKGSTGAQGIAGTAGTSYSISSGFACSKASGGLVFHYTGIAYSSGDAWVECDVAGSSFQVTATRIYTSVQNGSITFGCLLTMDSDASATSGFWYFTANSGKKAVYNDAGSGIDQSTVTFSTSDCTTF